MKTQLFIAVATILTTLGIVGSVNAIDEDYLASQVAEQNERAAKLKPLGTVRVGNIGAGLYLRDTTGSTQIGGVRPGAELIIVNKRTPGGATWYLVNWNLKVKSRLIMPGIFGTPGGKTIIAPSGQVTTQAGWINSRWTSAAKAVVFPKKTTTPRGKITPVKSFRPVFGRRTIVSPKPIVTGCNTPAPGSRVMVYFKMQSWSTWSSYGVYKNTADAEATVRELRKSGHLVEIRAY